MARRHGITNQQAKYLGLLCRELGLEYVGNGLTCEAAGIVIEALEQKREARNEGLRVKFGPAAPRRPREVLRPVGDGFDEACEAAKAASPDSWRVIHLPGEAWRAA